MEYHFNNFWHLIIMVAINIDIVYNVLVKIRRNFMKEASLIAVSSEHEEEILVFEKEYAEDVSDEDIEKDMLDNWDDRLDITGFSPVVEIE